MIRRVILSLRFFIDRGEKKNLAERLVREARTHVGKLAGGVSAAPVLLQGPFLIGTQDFGGRAVPLGFCRTKRKVDYLIPGINRRTNGLVKTNRMRL